MSRDLAALLDTAARVVPGLHGRLGPAGPAWCDATPAELGRLHRHLRHAHPEAGPHYWSLRCWGLHIWQPIYLAVLGVHLRRCCPRLACLSQRARHGTVSGFTLARHAAFSGPEALGLAQGAAQLAAGCARLLARWQEVGPLPAKSARRLQADCVLGALLAIRAHRPDWTDAILASLGARWLDAQGLAGESGFLPFRAPDGSARLDLGRKGCCLHYRRRDACPCDTCPRLTRQERTARLAAACAR